MWNKIKSVLAFVGGGLLLVGSFLLGIFLSNKRNSASGDGADTERPSETNRRAEEERRKLEESTGKLADSNRRFGEILEEIRKNKESDDGSSPSGTSS